MKEYMNELAEMDLFRGISEENLAGMMDCLGYGIKKYRKGEFIILEDDDVKNICIVIEGKVDMVKEDIWGNETTFMRIRKNEVFGESFACSTKTKALITFRVAADAVIMFLPYHRVMHSCSMTCRFHHRLIENMVSIISDKNQELMKKLDIISKRTLREKILAFLSMQAQITGSQSFEIDMGRIELADYLCTDRSALTRELNNMRNEGLIEFERNSFTIC